MIFAAKERSHARQRNPTQLYRRLPAVVRPTRQAVTIQPNTQVSTSEPNQTKSAHSLGQLVGACQKCSAPNPLLPHASLLAARLLGPRPQRQPVDVRVHCEAVCHGDVALHETLYDLGVVLLSVLNGGLGARRGGW